MFLYFLPKSKWMPVSRDTKPNVQKKERNAVLTRYVSAASTSSVFYFLSSYFKRIANGSVCDVLFGIEKGKQARSPDVVIDSTPKVAE